MNSETVDTVRESRERLAVAGGIALLVAGLLLVAVVMPAEYGVDPLGTGARLGLTALGETAKQVEQLEASAGAQKAGQPPVVAQDKPFTSERVDFQLKPGEGMEYKYRLEAGEALLFAWSSTAPVNYELHAEPDGAPRGYAQSYEKGTRSRGQSGTVNAPFTGIHGWFWENTTDAPIVVTLNASGYFNLAHEFRTGAPVRNKTFP